MCCIKIYISLRPEFPEGDKKKKSKLLYINLTAIMVFLWINVVFHKQTTSADLHSLLKLEKK